MWAEQSLTFMVEPGIRVHLNAPEPGLFREGKKISLVCYALPNGNTIEQTAGKQVREGVDWHYGIQHIAAQMRLLRKRDTSTSYVLAYLEAARKSWPAWRKATPHADQRIHDLVDTLRGMLPGDPTVTLAAHSGGGSFLFGFLNASDSIPDVVSRFVFLDANYEFDTTDRHDVKLAKWLRSSREHALVVAAYDDRHIVLNGKPVIGPVGGTYRRTREMASAFARLGIFLEESRDSLFVRLTCRDPFIVLAVHQNPSNQILHTVLVERNGLLFGLSAFTPASDLVSPFWGAVEYGPYIQP